MSEYTKGLTAEQMIEYIANDYVELSHEKIVLQRNDHMKICREWLQHQDLLAGAEIHAGFDNLPLEEGTREAYEAFVKARNYSYGDNK